MVGTSDRSFAALDGGGAPGFGGHLALEVGTDPQAVFRALAKRDGVRIERFELEEPSLDDIFVTVVQEGRRV